MNKLIIITLSVMALLLLSHKGYTWRAEQEMFSVLEHYYGESLYEDSGTFFCVSDTYSSDGKTKTRPLDVEGKPLYRTPIEGTPESRISSMQEIRLWLEPENPTSDDEISLHVENCGTEEAILGEFWTLEMKLNGDWYKISMHNAYNSAGIVLPPEKGTFLRIALAGTGYNSCTLLPGDYRVILEQVGEKDGKLSTVSLEFQLK